MHACTWLVQYSGSCPSEREGRGWNYWCWWYRGPGNWEIWLSITGWLCVQQCKERGCCTLGNCRSTSKYTKEYKKTAICFLFSRQELVLKKEMCNVIVSNEQASILPVSSSRAVVYKLFAAGQKLSVPTSEGSWQRTEKATLQRTDGLIKNDVRNGDGWKERAIKQKGAERKKCGRVWIIPRESKGPTYVGKVAGSTDKVIDKSLLLESFREVSRQYDLFSMAED